MLVISLCIYFEALTTFNPIIQITSSRIFIINTLLTTTDSFGWSIGMECGMRIHTPYLLITGFINEDGFETFAYICAICSYVHALMLCYFKHFGDFALCASGWHILLQVLYAHSDAHPSGTLKMIILSFVSFWFSRASLFGNFICPFESCLKLLNIILMSRSWNVYLCYSKFNFYG